MNPTQKFDMVARSTILRAEKPNKPIEALPAPNAHQMNRVRAYLSDGKHVVVSQRAGAGNSGMDFTKLLGGKIFAVAADAMSPVFEKNETDSTKRSTVQKLEDGLPLYSCKGFYSLSTKEYPALLLDEVFTRLIDKGTKTLLVSQAQWAAREHHELLAEFDWDFVQSNLLLALGDDNNLVAKFDADINKRRRRGIDAAKLAAEDDNEAYTGAEFAELQASKKDGNPFIAFAWRQGAGPARAGYILREVSETNDAGRTTTTYRTAEEAVESFLKGDGAAILAHLGNNEEVTFGFVAGNVMRNSPSFQKKVENTLAAAPEKQRYGDAVYVLGALEGWTKGIVTVFYSQHPTFPRLDYDAHHYVVAPRQAEVGMNKNGDKWLPPKALHYHLNATLLTPVSAVAA